LVFDDREGWGGGDSALAALDPDRDRLKPRLGSCERIAHPVDGAIEQLA
jgi:hypothetical protein